MQLQKPEENKIMDNTKSLEGRQAKDFKVTDGLRLELDKSKSRQLMVPEARLQWRGIK